MTKVNDKREQQRAEQARAEQARTEKRMRNQSRQQSDDFARLVGQNQKPVAEKKTGAKRQPNRDIAPPNARVAHRADNALLARQGIRANQFQRLIAKKGTESLGRAKDEVKHRDGDRQEARERMDLKPEGGVDTVERDEQRGSQTGGEGLGGDTNNDQQDSNSAGGFPQGSSGEVAAGSLPSEPIEGAPRSKLPAVVLDKIVKQVLVGVNAKGMGEVHIDFKGSGLDGTSMVLTSQGSKIYAKVITDNRNLGRLFKASHTELARAMREGSNLSLEELDVVGPT